MKSGKTAWRSPSNIAIVKYWGKKGFQSPGNPSVSMTLTNCYTDTFIEYSQKNNPESPSFNFTFQGKSNVLFEPGIDQSYRYRSIIRIFAGEADVKQTVSVRFSIYS